jgi:hypothetical protein
MPYSHKQRVPNPHNVSVGQPMLPMQRIDVGRYKISRYHDGSLWVEHKRDGVRMDEKRLEAHFGSLFEGATN